MTDNYNTVHPQKGRAANLKWINLFVNTAKCGPRQQSAEL